MTERWRVIPGWPDYEVSEAGRVRRLTPGHGTRGVGYIFNLSSDRKGYLRAALTGRDGTHRFIGVHRLVLMAFVGEPGPGMEGNHKSGDKGDNRVENLEWVTPDENTRHKVAMGLQRGAVGVSNGKAKLTEDQVREIRRLRGTATTIDLAARFGVSNQLISAIHKGHIWKHVT